MIRTEQSRITPELTLRPTPADLLWAYFVLDRIAALA